MTELQLFVIEDQALLFDRDLGLSLNLGLDIKDRVVGNHVQSSDVPSRHEPD